MRQLNSYEAALIEQACKLTTSIEDFEVEDIHPEDHHWYHIRFHYPMHPWTGGGYTILADLVASDADGASMSLLALGDDARRVYEIEIRRLDRQAIRALPRPDSWAAVSG